MGIILCVETIISIFKHGWGCIFSNIPPLTTHFSSKYMFVVPVLQPICQCNADDIIILSILNYYTYLTTTTAY